MDEDVGLERSEVDRSWTDRRQGVEERVTEQKSWSAPGPIQITFSDGVPRASVRNIQITLYRTFFTTESKYESFATLSFEKLDYWKPYPDPEKVLLRLYDKNDVLLTDVKMDEMQPTCKKWAEYKSQRDFDPKYFDAAVWVTPGSEQNTYKQC